MGHLGDLKTNDPNDPAVWREFLACANHGSFGQFGHTQQNRWLVSVTFLLQLQIFF
jgi:hypothetical protein